MKRFGLLAFGVLALVACGGGGDGGTGPVATTIAVSAGDDQVGAAGTALPESLAAIVRDQSGAPLAGANVTFTITAGSGGSVSPASRVTSAAGIAKTRWTLGPNAGTQIVTASSGSLTPRQFSAISRINGAVNIANNTTGLLSDTVGAIRPESLAVLVTNENATPVPGVTVAWTAAGGSVSATSVPTSAAGLSKVQFTYGTAVGNQSATATVTGLVGSPVPIAFTATAGTAVGIVATAGQGGTAAPGSPVTYTVQSRDAHGNPRGGVTIDWAVASGGGTITPGSNVTGTNGNASATRTLGGTAGDQTATATAAALPGTPQVTFTTTAATVTTATVQVSNDVFTPSAVTISQGGTVTWEWQGTTDQHNVTFGAGGPGNIPDRNSGSVSRTFNTAGTFNYACTRHPPGMVGSVTVTSP